MSAHGNGTGFEVHEHGFIRGRWDKVSHSHEGGDASHEHPDTGPACYTIDRAAWARATGLSGGGRKRFTAKPSGERLPLIKTEPATFDVFILDSAQHASRVDGKLHAEAECDGKCGDPVGFAAERMKLAFGMTARVHDLRASRARAKGGA
jgi:hypothetical protein